MCLTLSGLNTIPTILITMAVSTDSATIELFSEGRQERL